MYRVKRKDYIDHLVANLDRELRTHVKNSTDEGVLLISSQEVCNNYFIHILRRLDEATRTTQPTTGRALTL